MIDAAAVPAVDDALPVAPDAPPNRISVVAFQRPLALALCWLAFTLGLMWFIVAGKVRVGAGHWLGQRLQVRIIWGRFLDFLTDHGANALMVGLVGLAAALALVGSLGLLWWVLGMREGDPESTVTPDVT